MAGKLSIAEIALATGFSHQSHLARHMRRAVGFSPRAIKRKVTGPAIAFDRRGRAVEAFRRIVKLGLGGTLGPGDQFVSWIHSHDFRAVEFLIGRDDISGPVNVASPNPIPNRDFMRIFREVLHRRIGLPAARWMLEMGVFSPTETELLLKSRRVVPGRLLEAGFEFEFPEFGGALASIARRGEMGEEELKR